MKAPIQSLLFLLAGLASLHADPISLFDGKTLEGWEYNEKIWRIEDGVITGGSTTEKIKTNYFISTKQSFQNFELKLKIKCSGDPTTGLINSGIQIRSMRAGGERMSGYQVDCGEGWFGKIYDEHRRNKPIAMPVDEEALLKAIDTFGWNDYRIRAEGTRIRVWINDVLATDYTEENPNIALDGVIAPQVHSGGVALVQFKDITVEELPPTPDAPTWESLGGVQEAIKLVKPPRKPKAGAKVNPQAKITSPQKGPDRVNFDFETEDLQGWHVVEGSLEKPVADNPKIRNGGSPSNKEGKFYLSTLETAKGRPSDKQIGILESPVFELTGDTIQLAVSGGSHNNTFAGLYTLDGKEIKRASGNNSELFIPKTWNVAKWVGKPVYLRLVDQNEGSWGHTTLDAFSAQGKLLPEETKKRQTNAKPEKASDAHPPLTKKTQSGRTEALTPPEELAGFTVPEGFVIELVASEENGVVNPIDLSFDDTGRLWTQTAEMYPLDPITGINFGQVLKLMDDAEAQANNPKFKRIRDLYQLKTKGTDKILILDDPTKPADGQLHVWADGLSIPQSILPYKDGAYVAHGSELFLLRDTDGDDKADKMESVLTGFGFTDTHTMAHLLVRSPGNYIHFSQGALNKGLVTAVASGNKARIDGACQVRFTLDGKDLEVVSTGPANMWGLQLRGNGQWYGTEANDRAFSVVPFEHGTAISGPAMQPLRGYQPLLPNVHDFRVGGTGISGLEFSDDLAGGFPEEWRDVALLANPITNKINAVRIVRNANGTVSAELLPDFLKSEDDWFRPVNLEFGPDGCLYVADFYNKIVSHNEVSTDHPDRDKSHGRIWRIRHESQPAREIPDVTKASPVQLITHLKSPILWEKRAAWQQIVDKGLTDLAPQLIAIAADEKADIPTRIHALWSLEDLDQFDESLIKNLITVEDENLRREAIRSLATYSITSAQVAALVAPSIEDSNAMIRSQAIRTLGDLDQSNPAVIALLVEACKPDIAGLQLGGSYERTFERFLARMALEKFPAELKAYLTSTSDKHNPANILWASQALEDENSRKDIFLNIWSKVSEGTIDPETFVAIANALGNKEIYSAVAPTFQDPANAENYVRIAIANQSRVQSKPLANILTPAVKLLIQSNDTLALGLNAIASLKITGLNADVSKISIAGKDPSTLRLLVSAMALNPNANSKSLTAVASDDALPLDLRVDAAHAIAQTDPVAGKAAFLNLIEGQDAAPLVSVFSQSKPGAKILINLYAEKKLTDDSFDQSSADRMVAAFRKDKSALAIKAASDKKIAEQKKLAASRIEHLVDFVGKNPGNAETGKATFASCLACHAVGSEGQNIAPPLDGSGLRDLEHLITAIVSPDDAVEGAYGLYRITKTDGSSVEGYLDKDEPLGKTVAAMGGGRIFVPTAEIKKATFVPGRSFMPPVFGGLPDETIADLIAYISTLK
ncbi:MAG: PVC-type heme-binding CxxCH protein [Luteolibacter sp.]